MIPVTTSERGERATGGERGARGPRERRWRGVRRGEAPRRKMIPVTSERSERATGGERGARVPASDGVGGSGGAKPPGER